ncbi:MAG TPA: AAA family ATPase [Nakamurella sp.]
MTITDLREQVAQVIENELMPGGLLDINGPYSTVNLYQFNGAITAARARFREQAVTDYLARQGQVDQDRRAAILTAGVPGAGKSTAMTRRGLAGAGWRILDADIMKDLILQEEFRTGNYQAHLARILPDGHPLMPRELAALVHQESVEMITTVRNRSQRLGENLLIEGTLAWAPYAVQLLTELAAEDHRQVAIIDVEVSETLALERTANVHHFHPPIRDADSASADAGHGRRRNRIRTVGDCQGTAMSMLSSPHHRQAPRGCTARSVGGCFIGFRVQWFGGIR